MKKIQKLCNIKKNNYSILENEIIKIVKSAHFICKKCLRVAKEKKHLCKSKAI